jgi:ferritin-like metal-binding protein YciE
MELERGKLDELLFQALETEKGGVLVYETALRCAVNEDLKTEWTEYLAQTKDHVEILKGVFDAFDLDAEKTTPGSEIVKMKGDGLVKAMEKALSGGDAKAAQLVAAECVVDAETKDHMNWELLDEAAQAMNGELKTSLFEAVKKIVKQEDEHLYHTMGWTRELWLDFLGLPAVLPPPEERKHVETAIGAARAKESRGKMLGRSSHGHARRAAKRHPAPAHS